MEPAGFAIGLIGMLTIITIYFWIVRRSQNESAQTRVE
jgi:hypothetical protein